MCKVTKESLSLYIYKSFQHQIDLLNEFSELCDDESQKILISENEKRLKKISNIFDLTFIDDDIDSRQ